MTLILLLANSDYILSTPIMQLHQWMGEAVDGQMPKDALDETFTRS
jgi:hypothetical protein